MEGSGLPIKCGSSKHGRVEERVGMVTWMCRINGPVKVIEQGCVEAYWKIELVHAAEGQ